MVAVTTLPSVPLRLLRQGPAPLPSILLCMSGASCEDGTARCASRDCRSPRSNASRASSATLGARLTRVTRLQALCPAGCWWPVFVSPDDLAPQKPLDIGVHSALLDLAINEHAADRYDEETRHLSRPPRSCL